MSRSLPPFDLIARALAGLGRVEDAIALLELAAARGGEEMARAQPLLLTLRARPDERWASPALRLDADLVEAIASEGRIAEAWVVGRAIDLGATVRGLELAQALGDVLSPVPPEESPTAAALYAEALRGSALAAQRLTTTTGASPDLRRRARILVRLLRGFSSAPSAEGPSPIADPMVREVVVQLRERRDLAWGARALARIVERPGARPLYEDVALLAAAIDRAASEEGHGQAATAPLEGPAVALQYARMFDLEQAERALRRVVLERSDDRASATLLGALSRVRATLDASSEGRGAEPGPSSPPAAPPPDWLNKRARKASVEGWASPRRGPTPVPYEDAVTSVLRPDDEAELHVRAGRPDKAIALYRELAERFPHHPRFGQRAEELAAQVAAREVVFADEMTIRRDLRPLAAAAAPEAAGTSSCPRPEPSSLEQEPTSLGVRLASVADRLDPTAPAPSTEETPLPEERTDPAAQGIDVTVRPIIAIG
jgi:hypothetical protein